MGSLTVRAFDQQETFLLVEMDQCGCLNVTHAYKTVLFDYQIVGSSVYVNSYNVIQY